MFRPSRASDRPVRYLEWRIRLFGVAAILAVFGIGADVEPLRWAALGVLAVAATLSILAGRNERDAADREERIDPPGDEGAGRRGAGFSDRDGL